MHLAITREISPRFCECELTHIDRIPIDLNTARIQHRGYLQAIRDLGYEVLELFAQATMPDSVFVEDTAIILPEAAIITQPGADSRKPETESIAETLRSYRKLVFIEPPGSLDGGDVLVLGKKIYVGLSTRSNQQAVDQMHHLLAEYGYQAQGVITHDCLHLKTAVSRVDDATLLINSNWVDRDTFKGFDLIEVDEAEPFAANCLPLGDVIIYPTTFPKTSAKLIARGYKINPVEIGELAKAEGAVTCCSLLVED